MNAIDRIYSNEVGISFFWKKENNTMLPKIQVVFKDTGFLLTVNELKDFSEACRIAKETQCCGQCSMHKTCRSLLLRTPSDKIDIAVSKEELEQIHELITGTIFKLELKHWIMSSSLN